MRHLSFSCSLLALVNLSVTAGHFNVYQIPRFYGIRPGWTVTMKCYALDYKLGKPQAMWHKAEKFTTNLKLKVNHPRATVASGMLTIKKVEIEDSGIYFCRINETWGLGTELQVFRHVDQRAAERRSTMKDLVIFIQTFLLMLLIALSLVKYNKLAKKEEAVYEEPEDHTYEGLEIENCGDLYEDIPAYSQYQRGEDIVESPDQE